jgi:uncharacterized protein
MSERPVTNSPEHPGPSDGPLLDHSPAHTVQRDYAGAGQAAGCYCGYCGAPLDPFFYFCLRCSTPYKAIEAITGTVRPAPLTDGQRIQRMAPHTWTVFWTFAAVVVGCALLSIPFNPQHGESPLFYFLATLAMFCTTAVFACIHWRPLLAQFKTSGFLKWEAWAGIGALVPLLAINFGMQYVARHVLDSRAVENPAEGLSLPAAILVFCVFPAITEEIAFRGLVQYWLEVSLTPVKALMLGSAMFAGLHLSVAFPYLFAVGMVLALVRRRTGSLYPGILIHFLHNLVVITCFGLV